ncbi:MAG TPA: GAF domain-containing sensor histidine kinase [Patescibacteria group bacterium]|nr:GAF domain-containing sensor histidine kinase [Patescibacteria group bacterium]
MNGQYEKKVVTAIDTTRLLGEVRRRSPRTIRSALRGLDEALGKMLDIDCCALDIPAERTAYITRRVPGVPDEAIYDAVRIPRGSGYRRVVLDRGGTAGSAAGGDAGLSVYPVPIFGGRERIATCSLIGRGDGIFGDSSEESYEPLVEILSAILQPYIGASRVAGERRGRSLRAEILESVGDELMMRDTLRQMMELSRAEFCAFYTEDLEDCFYIMLEGAELSPRIPEIREKLRRTYRMFSLRQDDERVPREKVFVKRHNRNIAYLLGAGKIESYFLVPVTFDTRVRGVLFIGSVLKDAFSREDIAVFQELAEEDAERMPLHYSIGGETGILEQLVNALPYGGALIAQDGGIKYANEAFRTMLDIRGQHPDTVDTVVTVSPYNLHGLWEEFRLLEHDIIDRELQSIIGHERTLAVTWVRLGNLSSDVESLILLKDISGARDREEAREEMFATVAHELRTPMTALKNSLTIMRDAISVENVHDGGSCRTVVSRFLETALRTATRLNVLVDGIVDASTFRVPDYALRTGRIDVGKFLEDSSFLFAESMRKKGITFKTSVHHSAAELVFDRDRMEQVIQNLLSNSMKHVPSGGTISIEVAPPGEMPRDLFPRIPWEYLWRPDYACIRVRDTGSGIPERVAEDINRQNRDTGSSVRPSHGLGLYIATRLVQRHGGALRIERMGEAGSAVSIYLPARVETGRVVRMIRSIERIIAGALARGITPLLYSIVKRGPHPWRAVAKSMRTSTIVNPTRGAIENEGCYLWPLGRNFATAVAMVDHNEGHGASTGEVDAEGILFVTGVHPEDVEIGWGIAPRDGKSYGELVTASLERIGVEPAMAVQKGVFG